MIALWDKIEKLAAETTPPPYSEDSIVSYLTRIYRVMILLGRLSNSELVFAPPEGHAIDFSQLPDNVPPLDDRVKSLVRRMPLSNPKLGYDIEVIANAHMVNYLGPYDLRLSRDINQRRFDWLNWDTLDADNVEPHDVLLLALENSRDGRGMVLDVRESELRPSARQACVGTKIDC